MRVPRQSAILMPCIALITVYYLMSHFQSSSTSARNHPSKQRPLVYNLSRPSSPRHHVVFLKTHKCGSSTIQNIMMRYGVKNNLTFVLPKDSSNTLGWPYPFDSSIHMRNSVNHPDILCHHSVFSTNMVDVMPSDSFYVTAVRDPYAQLRSTYLYNDIYDCSNLTFSQLVSKLSEPEYEGHECSVQVLNPILYDLGLSHKQSKSNFVTRQTKEYIDMLDMKMNFAVVVEYFDESIIILRDMLGWSNTDVVYFAQNFQELNKQHVPARSRVTNFSESISAVSRERVYEASAGDALLYKHFKNKLERTISENRRYITEEKAKLRQLQQRWMKYCVKKVKRSKVIRDLRFAPYSNNAFGYVLTVDGLRDSTCIDMATSELSFTKRLSSYQSPRK